jgi:hypothetical protein
MIKFIKEEIINIFVLSKTIIITKHQYPLEKMLSNPHKNIDLK